MRSDYQNVPEPSAKLPKLPNLASIIAAMAHPCFELDTAEASTMLLAFAQARQQGYQADAFCIALVNVLRRQLVNCDDCMEDQFDVQDFEDDRPDDEPVGDEFEDGEFSSLEPFNTYSRDGVKC